MPKITDLTALTAAGSATTDVIPIVDVSVPETKKMTLAELTTAIRLAAPSYLGYNTVGASDETATAYRVYMKKITVPSTGVLLNIAAHVKNDAADNAQQVGVAVFSDNAGAPLRVLAVSMNPAGSVLLESVAATPVYRWLAVPMNLDVVAGDYWIAVMLTHATAPGAIAYDASGTDRYYTSGGAWFSDAGYTAVTTGTLKYSIRSLFMPTA